LGFAPRLAASNPPHPSLKWVKKKAAAVPQALVTPNLELLGRAAAPDDQDAQKPRPLCAGASLPHHLTRLGSGGRTASVP
jgi:hypothetical protein